MVGDFNVIYDIGYVSGWSNDNFKIITFPAGETQIRLTEKGINAVKEADEIRVWATIKDGNLFNLSLLIDAIAGIQSYKQTITLILPYLPYSRADRRFTEGDCYALRMASRCIENMDIHKIITLDAHSSKAEDLMSGLIYKNVSPEPLIIKTLKVTGDDTAILLPDKGASRYKLEKLAPVYQCDKKRNPETGQLLEFIVPENIKEKQILIVDDICDGGGTFLGISDALDKIYGRYKLIKYLYVTHGIFSKGEDILLKDFFAIFTTNSFYCNIFKPGVYTLDITEVIEKAIND